MKNIILVLFVTLIQNNIFATEYDGLSVNKCTLLQKRQKVDKDYCRSSISLLNEQNPIDGIHYSLCCPYLLESEYDSSKTDYISALKKYLNLKSSEAADIMVVSPFISDKWKQLLIDNKNNISEGLLSSETLKYVDKKSSFTLSQLSLEDYSEVSVLQEYYDFFIKYQKDLFLLSELGL